MPQAEYYFNLVLFVVLVAVPAPGPTMARAAKAAGVVVRLHEAPEEVAGVLRAGFVFVEGEVRRAAPAEHRRLYELRLPSGEARMAEARAREE